MRAVRNPIEELRQMTEDHYGDFVLNRGRLQLTFSREASGDGNLRLLLSEICSIGVTRGDLGVLPQDFFDQLGPDTPFRLARNVDLYSGQDPDYLIVDIRTMDLA
ncbi:MAG: hypothetical protein KJ017_09155 [Alphaproteobacteria bacterium]|nr:hypothetical protein [Alphaproteobacteria bacterium]